MSEAKYGEITGKRTYGLPPTECELTRVVIRDAMIYFGRTTYFLDEEDEGYDIQQETLSGVLSGAEEAFDSKPDGCEMQCDKNDHYYCERCGFDAEVSPLQS